jgi:TRAP transporter TAXI family solute receptor
MKTVVSALVVIGIALSLFVGCSEGTTLLNIASGPLGGSWHPIGGAMGQIINKHVEGVRVNVESTGGGVENVRLLGSKQVDIALTIAATALDGYRGAPPYQQAYSNLRTLVPSFELGYLQMVVLEESSLEWVDDIRGRRVTVGPVGHGSIPRQREIYRKIGMSFEDFTPVYLPYLESLQALGDGRVDVSIVYNAPPASIIKQFGVTNGFRLLSLHEQHLKALTQEHPYFLPVTIPKDVYGLERERDTLTAATSNAVLVRESLPDELVYQITRALFEHLDDLRAGHPSMQSFEPQTAVLGQVLPLHPGAQRYFQELGLVGRAKEE